MKKKVLVVEDTDDIRDAMRLLIESKGYEVITVGDGPSAHEAARNLQPDLILMDLAMHPMTGLDAADLISKDPLTSGIPIVHVSSYAGEYEDEAREAGSLEVYTKEAFMDNFEDILKKYLQ